ncbi:MAG: ATP-dependent DNA helicase RecG [Pseudomonadota bacterium]
MNDRPAALFPLFAALETLPGVGPKTAEAFDAQGIRAPRDLLFRLPLNGHDRRLRETVRDAPPGSIATVEVKVGTHRKPSKSGQPYRVEVEDSQISFQLVFFHSRGGYLKGLLPVGSRRVVSGKIDQFDNTLQMTHPDHVLPVAEAAHIPAFEPVYPLGAGISARVMAQAVAASLKRLPERLAEWLDPALIAREAWPDFVTALQKAHQPTEARDLSAVTAPRLRLAYDEFFAHQLMLGLARQHREREAGRSNHGDGALRAKVLAGLPYEPTSAQSRAVSEIEADMADDGRMYRLLQGDVGSGKTFVALMALLIAVETGGQGAFMAPTEILARQHGENLRALLHDLPLRIETFLGADSARLRSEKQAALAEGEIDIAIGTHALYQESVQFHDLRLAVIDEQHRFGVRERLQLKEKGLESDVLVMTATPIPRSLALSVFGDMALSVLDEKPPGRKPIKTALTADDRLSDVVAHLRDAVSAGRQAYWVCPLVHESELTDLVAAEDRAAHLRRALGEAEIALVHGQMPTDAKEAEMSAFRDGQRLVLVATTAIEVGVDVPNASIMVIERAESFGLAQLHQLRGRVGRGAAESTCLLLYREPLSESARRRLALLRETEDGFRIAEEDLAMRGAGDVLGTVQSGLPRFRMADAESQTGLMMTARRDALALLTQDPGLDSQRGEACRVLLDLMDHGQALGFLSTG